MSADEIHRFLTTNPTADDMRSALKAEGLLPNTYRTKAALEAALLDLMEARR